MTVPDFSNSAQPGVAVLHLRISLHLATRHLTVPRSIPCNFSRRRTLQIPTIGDPTERQETIAGVYNRVYKWLARIWNRRFRRARFRPCFEVTRASKPPRPSESRG